MIVYYRNVLKKCKHHCLIWSPKIGGGTSEKGPSETIRCVALNRKFIIKLWMGTPDPCSDSPWRQWGWQGNSEYASCKAWTSTSTFAFPVFSFRVLIMNLVSESVEWWRAFKYMYWIPLEQKNTQQPVDPQHFRDIGDNYDVDESAPSMFCCDFSNYPLHCHAGLHSKSSKEEKLKKENRENFGQLLDLS